MREWYYCRGAILTPDFGGILGLSSYPRFRMWRAVGSKICLNICGIRPFKDASLRVELCRKLRSILYARIQLIPDQRVEGGNSDCSVAFVPWAVKAPLEQ